MRLGGNTGRKKAPKIRHLCTIAQLCHVICSQLRHISTIGKKLVKQRYLLHLSAEYGKLWLTYGTPANFNRFCVLAALLHGTLVVGICQTLQR